MENDINMANNPFEPFVGKEVKAPYRDGSHLKVARGVLEDTDDHFVRVSGKLGTIIINVKNIEAMTEIDQSI